MSDIAPDIFPFLVAALEDERRESNVDVNYNHRYHHSEKVCWSSFIRR